MRLYLPVAFWLFISAVLAEDVADSGTVDLNNKNGVTVAPRSHVITPVPTSGTDDANDDTGDSTSGGTGSGSTTGTGSQGSAITTKKPVYTVPTLTTPSGTRLTTPVRVGIRQPYYPTTRYPPYNYYYDRWLKQLLYYQYMNEVLDFDFNLDLDFNLDFEFFDF